MKGIVMSPAAAALIRALIVRSGAPRDRILLTEVESTDWQSLTFTGERHRIGLRVAGPESTAAVGRMVENLEDSEFEIPGLIVADIGLVGTTEQAADGSTAIAIEALTVSED
jgi:hypothetical protein